MTEKNKENGLYICDSRIFAGALGGGAAAEPG